MSAEPWYPPQIYPVIVAGASFHWETPPFIDVTTGQPFDWTAEPDRWELVAEMRDRTGSLLATFDNIGTPAAGSITAQADGILAFDLHYLYTATLPLTRPYTNSTDPRVSGWHHRGSHAMDLVLTDLDDDEIYTLFDGSVTVQQMVTGGS